MNHLNEEPHTLLGQRLSQGEEGLPLQPAACFSWQQGEGVSPNMLPMLGVHGVDKLIYFVFKKFCIIILLVFYMTLFYDLRFLPFPYRDLSPDPNGVMFTA